jgi:two-component system, NtrC family, response regulator GlrR
MRATNGLPLRAPTLTPADGVPRGTLPAVPGTREISRHKYEIARFRVSVVRGVDAPAACESSGVELTIGTADGNDLQLTDPAVSRHHCVLAVTPHGVELRDLDSTNGTTLAGFRVTAAYVTHGALIGCGETVLRIELLPDRLSASVSHADRFGPVLGRSLAMRRLFAIAAQVAPSEATVLIEGETGTGKGLLAEAIHAASRRAQGPFVTVDCAAMPPQLMESELFGHEAGAFTGARNRRIGLFESAAGGTLLLDEIGELPLELQPKLLRAIERREVRRIGSTTRIVCDVRIIAATNRDLRREVNRGAFRSDLWYRLNTVRLAIPPLRERRDDIPLLVAHFFEQMAPDPAARPPSDLIAKLLRADWRGNIRELANAVERALFTSDPAMVEELLDGSADHGFDASLSFRAAKERATADWEQRYLTQLLARHDGNVSRAARAARMDRSHLHGLLRRHGLIQPGGRTDEDTQVD